MYSFETWGRLRFLHGVSLRPPPWAYTLRLPTNDKSVPNSVNDSFAVFAYADISHFWY